MTLLASSVADCAMSMAWLSLNKDDSQAVRFLSCLVVALQQANREIWSQAAQLLAAARQPAPEAILACLVNDLDAAGGETALVLDDY